MGSRREGLVKANSTGRVLCSPNTVPATVNPSEDFVAGMFHAEKRSLNKRLMRDTRGMSARQPPTPPILMSLADGW